MPSVLSSTERDELRALTVSFFPDTCQIATSTIVKTGGDWTKSQALGTSQPCKLRTTGFLPTEREIASRVETGQVYAVDLAYGTAVKAKDAILLNGARRFEVVGVVEGGYEDMDTTAMVVERNA